MSFKAKLIRNISLPLTLILPTYNLRRCYVGCQWINWISGTEAYREGTSADHNAGWFTSVQDCQWIGPFGVLECLWTFDYYGMR